MKSSQIEAFCSGLYFALSFLVSIVFFVGCSTSSDAEKQIARDALRNKGIPFTVPAFIKTSYQGQSDNVDLFIKGGMEVDSADDETALLAAVRADKKEIVEMLLNNGADCNVDSYMGSPLCLAAKNGSYEISQMLIEHGAKENYYKYSVSPLLNAIKYNHPEITELLILSGADADWADPVTGKTLLMVASENGNNNIIDLLLENGADINEKDKSGSDALYYAALNGRKEAVALLLDKGASMLNKKGLMNRSVITAFGKNDKEIIKIMLDKGLDVNGDVYEKIPLLLWLVKNKYFDGAKTIIENGANTETQDTDGQNTLDYALASTNKEFIEYLKSKKSAIDKPTEIKNNNE